MPQKNKLSLSVQYPDARLKETITRAKVRRWVLAALFAPAELTVRFVDAEEGRALNRDYRSKDYATNVLTFAYTEDEESETTQADIILCTDVDTSTPGELTIKNYSVVNGAQSLTSFYANKAKLTEGLRVLVRVIKVQDEVLAKTITHNSNNQNAIRPRDLRSNHSIMVRLQKEMAGEPGDYFFEIKRGETAAVGSTVITNDEIGRALETLDSVHSADTDSATITAVRRWDGDAKVDHVIAGRSC